MTRSVSQRNTACNRNHTINFTIESLAFQNRPLNGAHSISDIKLFCLNITVFPNFAKFWLEGKNDSGQLKICSNEKTLYFKIFVRFNFSMTKLFKFLVASLIFSAGDGGSGVLLMTFLKWEKLLNFKVLELSFTTKFIFVFCYSPYMHVKYQS